jgi:hypothetical protein
VIDDRAMGVERHQPGRGPEVELVVVHHQGRDLVLVLEDGEELVFDWAELRLNTDRPAPWWEAA